MSTQGNAGKSRWATDRAARSADRNYAHTFMGLPPELRLYIAEYVMYDAAGLEFFWRHPPDPDSDEPSTLCLGSIAREGNTDTDVLQPPLARTCRQVYAETRHLAISINTINVFNEELRAYFSLTGALFHDADGNPRIQTLPHMLSQFHSCAPAALLPKLRHVRIHTAGLEDELDVLTRVADKLRVVFPNAHVTFRLTPWDIRTLALIEDPGLMHPDRATPPTARELYDAAGAEFVKIGNSIAAQKAELEEEVGRVGYTVCTGYRGWDEFAEFVALCPVECRELLRGWVERGI